MKNKSRKQSESINNSNDKLLLSDVKHRIKSTCNRCRASEWHNECSLGYNCDTYTPKVPCPKPLTIQQLIDAPKYGA